MKAYAKINLTLEVLNKRKDNYHNINSIMQQIDLYDELQFSKSKKVIVISPFKDDIMLKTVLKIKKLFDIPEGIKINVKKNIPAGAGLGGGSSDAAATLIKLNERWDLKLSTKELINIGVEIGADVPFCIVGGCCQVSGIGEKIKRINGKKINIVLVNPGYKILTKTAYARLDRIRYKKTEKNDFINVQKPIVHKIIKEIIGLGASEASITGKGPTVFGIFNNKSDAIGAYKKIKNKYHWVHACQTIK